MLYVLKTTCSEAAFRYPYDEFADHVRAMKTVRTWEDTCRFGHLGKTQDSRASSARVVEYFSDSYADPREALHKAELFLLIHDYIGRHRHLFLRKGMLEQSEDGVLLAEPGLLRAAHHVFTTSTEPAHIAPKKVLILARAFKEIEV